jgi:hypothetical protein
VRRFGVQGSGIKIAGKSRLDLPGIIKETRRSDYGINLSQRREGAKVLEFNPDTSRLGAFA